MEPAWISLFMKPLITPLSCIIVLNQLNAFLKFPSEGVSADRWQHIPLCCDFPGGILSEAFSFAAAWQVQEDEIPVTHVTLFEANLRIPQNCGCTKLLWICHLLSVYLTLQAGRLSLSYLSLHWSLRSTHTISCTYAQYFSIAGNLNSKKPVSLFFFFFFRAKSKGLAIISKF